MICGGIDLGGTKIEARLFDGAKAETLAVHRRSTPLASFDALLSALIETIAWLASKGGPDIPIGLSIAGLINPQTGISSAANLPTTGHPIADSLAKATGRTIPVLNDCMAFTYSEAVEGAGKGARCVAGLIIGTGVGGGICIDGKLPYRHAGLGVEVGHLGLSAASLERHKLPVLQCGCGQSGCVETYVAGPGLARLAQARLGRAIDPATLALDTSAQAEDVLAIWADLAAEALYAMQITLDPDCIVLGGGLSNIPGCAERLCNALARRQIINAHQPEILPAHFGATSGARGAALIAMESAHVEA